MADTPTNDCMHCRCLGGPLFCRGGRVLRNRVINSSLVLRYTESRENMGQPPASTWWTDFAGPKVCCHCCARP